METKNLEFTCGKEEYIISICDSKFYPNYLGLIGIIEIGYGKPIVAKKIIVGKKSSCRTFLGGLLTTEIISNKNKHTHSYSFVKEFITKLEDCISGNISNDELISFKAISESRRKLFDRLLTKNGWNLINSYDSFYCKDKKYDSAFFEQIKLFGIISLTIN